MEITVLMGQTHRSILSLRQVGVGVQVSLTDQVQVVVEAVVERRCRRVHQVVLVQLDRVTTVVSRVQQYRKWLVEEVVPGLSEVRERQQNLETVVPVNIQLYLVQVLVALVEEGVEEGRIVVPSYLRALVQRVVARGVFMMVPMVKTEQLTRVEVVVVVLARAGLLLLITTEATVVPA